jgi:hypothetical protein
MSLRRHVAGCMSAALLVLGGVAAGCGGGADAPPEAAPAARFDAGEFAGPASAHNAWLPLEPGLQTVREGSLNRGHRKLTHRRVYTVTDVVKRIDGVRAVAVLDQDFNGGELAEQAIDFLAQDRRGNVWSMGSYTETYEGGQFVNATDGWLSGVDGSRAGILLRAEPRPGMRWVESTVAGDDPEPRRVVDTGLRKCVPLRCYDDVVAIGEGADSDEPEYKYYAPGVGGITTEPRYSGGEQEKEILVNATQLSRRGLAEMSAEALRLDTHARTVARDVFGPSAPAARDR